MEAADIKSVVIKVSDPGRSKLRTGQFGPPMFLRLAGRDFRQVGLAVYGDNDIELTFWPDLMQQGE